MIRLAVIPIADLTPEQYRQCYNLNLRGGGLMRSTLSNARRVEDDCAFAILATEQQNLIGWCLMIARDNAEYTAQFYVRESHRRQGVGTKLIKLAHKLQGPLKTGTSYKRGSAEFFDKHRDLLK